MRWHLAIIIALASVLYFYQLGRSDIITDESSLATRAIGMVDFDFGIEQPTPWQWVDKIPWWMRLSFHDHPPLVFLLQHWSIRLFGENPTAIRIPSALAGIASVIFLYFIGKRLYSPAVGAISALLFAVTVNHVWISRIGLQESILIAFILAGVYYFLRAFMPASVSIDHTIGTDRRSLNPRNKRWFAAAGLFLGLAFLAKYTALIFIPIFATILFLYRKNHNPAYKYDRKYKRKFLKNIIFAVLALLAAASPVIIYNLQLYRSFGHFDFQFSLLAGQDVPAWQARPGQEVLGSLADRIRLFVPRLIEANSPYFLAIAAIGIAFILWGIIRRRSLVISHWPASHLSFAHSAGSLVIIFVWLLPFLVFVGPAHRFLTILTPWLALAAGYVISIAAYSQILKNLRIRTAIMIALIVVVVVIEALYSYNSVIALEPVGKQPWAYSYLRRQAGTWGFNELEKYLAAELKDKMPETAITFEFPFAKDLLNKAVAAGQEQKLEAVPLGIVYNDNINLSAQLWVFLRRIAYQGWPVASAENFRSGGAEEFFRQSGIKQIIFINAAEHALQDRTRPATSDGDIMESQLRIQGAMPREIKNPRGEIAFRAYRFELK